MKDLLILGAGVHAAEMAEIVGRVNQEKKAWNLLGFIVRNPEDVGKIFNETQVVDSFENIEKYRDVLFAASNHNKLPHPLPVPVKSLVSLIDPSAFVARNVKIGAGCVVYPNCFIGIQARLGDLVFMLANCVVNHDVVLEDRVILTSGVVLAGGVHIEENCYLGQSCAIREKIKVGRGSLVGMGAVVTRDVAPGVVVAGNPARKLKDQANS